VARFHSMAVLAGVLAAGAAVPVRAQEPTNTPAPTPAAGEQQPGVTGAAAGAPAAVGMPDPRDKEIAELKRIVEDLRKRLSDSEALKSVVEELMKRIEKLEAERPAPTPEPPQPQPEPSRGGGATFIPNISAVGNLVLGAGDTKRVPNRGRFNFTEFELAFQDQVTAKLRYDVFLAAAKEEEWSVGMEEGYLTATALIKGLNARIGRIRTPIGKFNRLHPHQWVFITQPSAVTAFLGPEGLNSDGAVLEYNFPTKGFFARAELGAWQTASEAEDGLGFGGGENGAYSGRFWLGRELGRDKEIELGASYYWGNGPINDKGNFKKSVKGLDLTYRAYPSTGRRLIVSAEAFSHNSRVFGSTESRVGGFIYAAYKPNPFWEFGARGDYTRFPFPIDDREIAGSLFVTKYLTEQTSLRLEYQYTDSPLLGTGNGIYFQILFGSGPHTHSLQ
jgi:hypothetical protein